MGVKAVCGRAGSGKTRLIYSIAARHAAMGGAECFLIMPRQFTAQAASELMRIEGLAGFMNLRVLSFDALARDALREHGGFARTRLDERARDMLIGRVAGRLSAGDPSFARITGRRGFPARMGAAIAEFKRWQVMPGQLDLPGLYDTDAVLAEKIKVVRAVYDAYLSYCSGRYADDEDALDGLISALRDGGFAEGSTVLIDGLESFTPQIREIISLLARRAKELYITFTLDNSTDIYDELFAEERDRFSAIWQDCSAAGIPFEQIDLPVTSVVKSDSLLYMESRAPLDDAEPYQGAAHDITARVYATAGEEAEHAAARIYNYVMQSGCRWREVSLLCPDIEGYTPVIRQIFDEYGIPYYIDMKQPLMRSPIIRGILACLNMISGGSRAADALLFAKSGISPLEGREANELQNYMTEYGIAGVGSVFRRGASKYDLERMNGIREKLTAPLKGHTLGGTGTVKQKAEALYALLENIKLEEFIKNSIDNFAADGMLREADAAAHIWEAVTELLDQLVGILGDTETDLSGFITMLEDGFAASSLATVPSTADAVLIGSVARSRSAEIKAQFIIGLSDEDFALPSETDGLLSFDELDEIADEADVSIGRSAENQLSGLEMSLYMAYSRPEKYLWISAAMQSPDGSARKPHPIIKKTMALFPDMEEAGPHELLSSPYGAMNHIRHSLRQMADGEKYDPLWTGAYMWYRGQDEFAPFVRDTEKALSADNRALPLSADTVGKRYAGGFNASITELESFMQCPFMHYVDYMLRPTEIEPYAIEAPDIGNILHELLQKFAVMGRDMADMTDERCDEAAERILSEIYSEYRDGYLTESPEGRFLAERLMRIGKRTVRTVAYQIRAGLFRPIGVEAFFGNIPLDLPDGGKASLIGKIDRVDAMHLPDGREYIRIVDYKSGYAGVDFKNLEAGLELQLPIYMEAMLERLPGTKPAAMLQYHIDDPAVRTQLRDEAAVRKEVNKKLRLGGVFLDDAEVLRAMDLAGERASDVVAVDYNKNTFSASGKVSEDGFSALLENSRAKAEEAAGAILSGRDEISPAYTKEGSPCRYCPYRSICGFDRAYKSNRPRYIK